MASVQWILLNKKLPTLYHFYFLQNEMKLDNSTSSVRGYSTYLAYQNIKVRYTQIFRIFIIDIHTQNSSRSSWI